MKLKPILEISLVLICTYLLAQWLTAAGLYSLEVSLYYYSYVTGLLHFGIPLAIIIVTKRSLQKYTMTKENLAYNLEVGINSYLASMVPFGLAFFFMWTFGLGFFEWPVALALSGGYVIAVWMILSYLKNREQAGTLTPDVAPSPRKTVITIVVLWLVPIFLGLYFNNISGQLVSLIIWQLVVSGFGEEFFWRGYIQTRLNDGFGRPFEIFDVKFGWGLIITSLLFGFVHGLNTFNIFTGTYDFALTWAVFTFFSGLFFGFIREKTKSLIATGLAHGLTDSVGEGIALVMGIAMT